MSLATALGGVLLGLLPPVLELEETAGLGGLLVFRGPVPPPDDVVVVSIGRESADALGLSMSLKDWPRSLKDWPRSLHAKVVTALHAAGASVIALDIHFSGPKHAEDDAALAAAIRAAGNVILLDRMERRITPLPSTGELVGRQELIMDSRSPTAEPFAGAAAASVPFPLPVVPVRVSQYWTFVPTAADAPTLPIAALQLRNLAALQALLRLVREQRPRLSSRLAGIDASSTRPLRLESAMRAVRGLFRQDPVLADELRARLREELPGALGHNVEKLIDVYSGPSSRYLNYYGPPRSVTTVPYHEIVQAGARGPDFWRGKAVFVGFSERTQPDQQDTFYSVYSQRSGLNMSGVEIAATAFANLGDSSAIAQQSIGEYLAFVIVFGLLVGSAVCLRGTGVAIAAAIAIGFGYGGFALHQFTVNAVWWPLAVPLLFQVPAATLAAILWNYVEIQRQREHIKQAVGLYLPQELVDRLTVQPQVAMNDSKLVHGVCMVTDATQYTTLSEKLAPADVGRLLNAYYGVLFEVVQQHGGSVTDVVGDSMVAVWHSMDASEAQTLAIRTGLGILQAVRDFNDRSGFAPLPTRIGIHGGDFMLGTVGAGAHLEFRAIGDTVNSASRVQDLNKKVGTHMLVTVTADPRDPELETREIGTFILPGKGNPLRIYEPLLGTSYRRDEWAELKTLFEAARERFQTGDWAEAGRAFDVVLARFEGDGPATFYRGLCTAYAAGTTDAIRGGALRLDEN